MVRYSLVHEGWVLCRMADGSTLTLSLRDVFARAREIREIVGDIPTQGFAILRVLLAIAHRAFDGPEDEDVWAELWQADAVPVDRIDAYLDLHRERFDLFGATPFMQTPGLRTAKGDVSGLEKLLADVPAGHPLFSTRIGRGIESLTYAEAARWLIHAQAFDVSGIKSGAVGDSRVKGGKGYPIGTGWSGNLGGLYVEGSNLWETILLNLIPIDQTSLAEFTVRDRPAWEAPPPGPDEDDERGARPFGPLDLYTWSSRRILLSESDGAVTGVVLTNGDRLMPQNMLHREPMTAWRRSAAQEKKLGVSVVYMPQEHDPARAIWRGLAAILPTVSPRGSANEAPDHVTAGVVDWAGRALNGDRALTLRAIGMSYGTQSSVVTDVMDDRLDLRASLIGPRSGALQRTVVAAVESTESGVLALRNLASNLVKAAGGTDAKLADGARDRAAEMAYAEFDGPFRRWVSQLDGDAVLDEVRDAWNRTARRIIRSQGARLVASASPDAWSGRVVGARRITTPEADGWFQAAVAKTFPLIQVRTEEAS